MSNSWSYEALFPRSLGCDDISQARHVVEERGYAPNNPVSGIISVVALNGEEDRKYGSIAEALTVLETEGGLLQLWKEDVDLFLTVQPASSRRAEGAFQLMPSGWSRLTLSVDGCFLRDEAARSAVAGDMWAMFVALCEQLGAAYGFSRNEDLLDAFGEELKSLPSVVVNGERPPLLFWLNYFRRDHFPWLDEEMFSRVGGWVTAFPRGMLVSIFDAPWEVELAALQETNRRWRGDI
jgi:hypothetical protein